MKFFLDDAQLEHYVAEKVETAVALEKERAAEARLELEGNHGWEVRRLTARAVDAEEARDRYRAGYKNALKKMGILRTQLAEATKRLMSAGLEPEVDSKTGRPKQTPVQEIMDEAMTLVPAMDDLSQTQVRSYVERELRRRGTAEKDSILQEVLTGSYADEGETEGE